MAKISYDFPLLICDIPDLVQGETIIKRKAELNFLLYQPRDRKVTISIQVLPFAAVNNQYGDRLDIPNSPFVSYEKVMYATDMWFVDAITGEVLCETKDEYSDGFDEEQNPIKIINPLLNNRTYVKEFEFYNMLANIQPVIINQLITQKIQVAFAEV